MRHGSPGLDRLRGRFRNRLSEDKGMIPHMAQSHQARKTLGGKSRRAEIKGVNVRSSALPDVERFS
jgi:hypothetical protein